MQNTYGEDKYEYFLQKSGIHIAAPLYYYRNLMLNKMYNKENNLATEKITESDLSQAEVSKKPVDIKEGLQYAPSFYQIQESSVPESAFSEKDSHSFTEWLTSLTSSTESEKNIKKSKQAQKTAETISQFINKDQKNVPKRTPKEPVRLEKEYNSEHFMSQTLAEIYVKQGLYDRAISIYQKLYLKSPEKNTTFARRIEEINELKNK